MALAATLSGATGNVTFASGYAVNSFSWEITANALVRETTPFSPAANYRQRATGNLLGWKGSYKCRQPVNATATITGPSYLSFPFAFGLRLLSNVEQLPATKFGDTWRSYSVGNCLLDVQGDYSCYIEDTAALPTSGTTVSATFTINTGLSYSVPIIIGDGATNSLHVDGSSRVAKQPWFATGAPTITGGPDPSITGAATFIAGGSRQHSGTIAIISAEISCNRDQPDAEWTINFLGIGALTSA